MDVNDRTATIPEPAAGPVADGSGSLSYGAALPRHRDSEQSLDRLPVCSDVVSSSRHGVIRDIARMDRRSTRPMRRRLRALALVAVRPVFSHRVAAAPTVRRGVRLRPPPWGASARRSTRRRSPTCASICRLASGRRGPTAPPLYARHRPAPGRSTSRSARCPVTGGLPAERRDRRRVGTLRSRVSLR
jgi:hypothetical protein